MAAAADNASPPPAPFVVGVARSGTTLLRLMLDAHPDLAIPPETHFVPRLIKHIDGGAGAGEAADFVTGHARWDDWGLDPGELRRRFQALEPFSAGGALRAFFGLYAEQHGKPRWGDKSPPHLKRMGRIQSALPEARFLHVIRDGRDVALSVLERSWGPATVTEAAQAWRDGIAKARRQAKRRLAPGTYTEVRYEELVAAPERVLREVAAAIDLPWNDVMLRYHEAAERRMSEVERTLARGGGEAITAEERAAQHALVRKPPTDERVERWRRELTPAQLEEFEAEAGELLAELGYPPA